MFRGADYRSWADEVDVISDDSSDLADPYASMQAALTHALMRSLAGRAVVAHGADGQRGQLARSQRAQEPGTDASGRDAGGWPTGADGVLSFQWRASPTGPERFHSAMLPHAGTDTRLHRAVQDLVRDLRSLSEVAGTDVPAEVAILFDWARWWAAEEPATPSDRLRVLPQLQAWYRPLWEAGIGVDVVHPLADLGRYRLVLAPQLYLLDDDGVANLRGYLASGGCLALGPFSAVTDGNARVRTGRSPVSFADLLDAGGEQRWPLPEVGAGLGPAAAGSAWLGSNHADTWAGHLRLLGRVRSAS